MSGHESEIIAALLRSPGRHESRLMGLDRRWFEDPIWGSAFVLLIHRPMTLPVFSEWLGKDSDSSLAPKILDRLPSLAAIRPLEDADVDYAARMIAERAEKEHILDRCRWIVEEVEKGRMKKAVEVTSLLAAEVPSFDVHHAPILGIDRLAEGAVKAYEVARRDGGAYVRTGFQRVDDALGGWKRKELWLVAGFTGMGKTFLSLQIAYEAWLAGKAVMWVPNEMSNEDMATLFLCRHSATLWPENPLKSRPIRRGTLSPDDRKRMKETISDIRKREAGKRRWHAWEPERAITIEDITNRLEGMKHRISVDLLVIDYLEQLWPLSRRKDGREELNDTLAGAKRLAKTYNGGRGLCLLSPHQINRAAQRECERRKPSPHYALGDLAESSRAERESDVILWVMRTMRMEKSGKLLLGCMKGRGERISDLRLGFSMMERFESSYIGEIADGEEKPDVDQDFDTVD